MNTALVILFFPLLVCWSLWVVFAVAAALPRRGSRRVGGEAKNAPRIDVLIPAHDEEVLLPRLLATLKNQTALGRIDRILVVADHCADATAELARASGASVLERSSGPRGKPAALRDGLAWLKKTTALGPTERSVLILDADCTVSANLVEEIAGAMSGGARVVQTAYRLEAQSKQNLGAPAVIAFALKNVVRPTGMARLGIPTQLFGTGMCFRADVLEALTFDDHLTEDLKISQDLLLAGIAPMFVSEAVVSSPLPAERKAMTTQKLRWETGQIQTWAKLPAMIFRLGIRGRFLSLLALADWSAPPVAMAIVYWFGLTAGSVFLVGFGIAPAWMLVLAALSTFLIFFYVVLGAMQVAGAAGTAKLFLAVPRFLLWKLSLYARIIRGGGARTWERTERGPEAESAAPVEPLVPPPDGEVRPSIPVILALVALSSWAATLRAGFKRTMTREKVAAPREGRRRVKLLGMPVDSMSELETLAVLTERMNQRKGTWVLTPNLDILRQYHRKPALRPMFESADFLLPDGMPLIWASRIAKLNGRGLAERVPGSSLAVTLAGRAADHGWRIFLLGGDPGTADAAAGVLRSMHPAIQIAGTACPRMGFEKDPAQLQELEEHVVSAGPDLVYVALGFPKQELLIQRLREVLPNTTFIGVGISLSFIAGTVQRAPGWIQRLGLEWAHRLMQEPKRLAKRYLIHDIPFALFILFPHALATRWRGDSALTTNPSTLTRKPL